MLIVHIADVIACRLQRERLVRRAATHEIELDLGEGWVKAAAHVYEPVPGMPVEEGIVALVLGDPARRPSLVRVHRECWPTDALRIRGIHRLHVGVADALRAIHRAGGGVFLRLPPAPDLTFARHLELRAPAERAANPAAERPPVIREFGVGAQILRDLGVEEFALITNNPRVFLGLEGFGLRIVRFVDPGEAP
jgi:3,4-dihydroxy 2-butanone 4-phosphate synthase/GTP cyclohydrolase II